VTQSSCAVTIRRYVLCAGKLPMIIIINRHQSEGQSAAPQKASCRHCNRQRRRPRRIIIVIKIQKSRRKSELDMAAQAGDARDFRERLVVALPPVRAVL
jgi:hypothetical protein